MSTRALNGELSKVIADNLKNERMKRNWSQKFVADQANLSVRTVSRGENGKGMSNYTLKALCRLYAIGPMDACRAEVHPEDSFGASTISPTRILNLLANSNFIHDIQREIVLSLLQSMKTESFISREQIKNVVYNGIGKKNMYTLEDLVKFGREINSLTAVQMMNVIRG